MIASQVSPIEGFIRNVIGPNETSFMVMKSQILNTITTQKVDI